MKNEAPIRGWMAKEDWDEENGGIRKGNSGHLNGSVEVTFPQLPGRVEEEVVGGEVTGCQGNERSTEGVVAGVLEAKEAVIVLQSGDP